MKRPPFSLTIVFIFCTLFFSPQVTAEEKPFSVKPWIAGSPILSGKAGSGSGAPDYNDAFDSGFGGGAEFSYRLAERFSVHAGIGYEKYSGSRYEDIYFDDLEIIPLYIGGKFHFTKNRTGWDPYLRADVGAAHMSSVDISFGGFKEAYWDSSWAFMFAAGAGIEYRFDRFGISLEVKARYLGGPESELGYPSDADPSWTLPVVLGASFYF